jgi:Helix-turn-helix
MPKEYKPQHLKKRKFKYAYLKHVRLLLFKEGLTQQYLCQLWNLKPQTVYRIMSGATCLSAKRLEQLYKRFGYVWALRKGYYREDDTPLEDKQL